MPLDKDGKEVVYQSNDSIRMNKNLTLPQWQVLFIAEAQLFPKLTNDMDGGTGSFLEVTVPATNVYQYFRKYGGSNRHDLFKQIKNACAQMMSLTLEERVYSDDLQGHKQEGFVYINVFEKISFTERNGLKFLFTQSMVPHLLNFWRGYTKIPVEVPFVISSNYAIKLFMLLMTNSFHAKRNHGHFWIEIGLDELRHTLGVPKDSYVGSISNFYKFVLDAPIKEIEKNLPYQIKRTSKKTGRKVTAIRFDVDVVGWSKINVSPNNDEQKPTDQHAAPPTQKPEAAYLTYVTLPRKHGGVFGVNPNKARDWVNQLGWERCKLISDSMLQYVGGMERPAGALINAWKRNELYNQHSNVTPTQKKQEPPPLPDSAFGKA